MFLYSIFITNDKGEVDELISLDVVTGFSERYAASIPEAPVESGFNVSDSINLSNPTFSLNGIISNSRFLSDGHLIEFRNGEFVKVSEGGSVTPVNTDDAAIKLRERLIKLYVAKEVFGILEYTDPDSAEKSQVRSIYPCALSDISLDKSDATDGIYVSMSIKNIRITEVIYKDVKNAVPDLIPLMKNSQDVGVSSNSGEAKIPSTEELPDASKVAAEQKKLAKDLTGNATEGINLGGDPSAHKGLRRAISEQFATKIAVEKTTQDVLGGKVSTDAVQQSIDKYTKQAMQYEGEY